MAVQPFDYRALDVTDEVAVATTIERERPDAIINCAAYTDVEGAEGDREAAFAVNDQGVGFVAAAAATHNARLIHISTDYVFSGQFHETECRPYVETDRIEPINVYGDSKLAGELRLADYGGALILRTTWLYGGCTKNFLSTMLRLGEQRRDGGEPLRVVDDVWGTPTDCFSLAEQIVRLLSPDAADLSGVVHASCEGKCTWFRFAQEIFSRIGWSVAVEPITSAEYSTRARRPEYSVLENRVLKQRGLLTLPTWQAGLARALQERGVE